MISARGHAEKAERERDEALHAFRCVEETEQYLNVLARAEKAELKAQHYETDWRAAKTEFGDAAARLREKVRAVERERDEARAEVTRRDALIARDGYEDMRQHAVALAQRLEKAEFDRDVAHAEGVELLEQRDRARRALAAEIETTRATKARVAELVTALEDCTEWMYYNPPADGWGLLDKRADAGRHEAIDAAHAALAKAKEGAS